MHLFYATYDGHTRRIAERIARQLAGQGVMVTPLDLVGSPSPCGRVEIASRFRGGVKGKKPPHLQKLRRYFVTPSFCFLSLKGRGASSLSINLSDLPPNEPIILIAALRYGFHLPEADRFLAAFQKARLNNPLVVLSVNLVARKPGKRSATGNPYLRRWLKRRKVAPFLAAAIAGRLDYPKYDWFDRMMIQFIMLLTRGPTDPQASVEFTDWDQVDEIAAQIAVIEKK